MDMVEELVKDEKVKGIWCVPLYANPDGTCYSDETVRRLVSMDCAAEDFRIFWDNSYGIHHLYEEKKLLNVIDACIEAGHPNRVLYFASTSKVTFPGAGVSIMAASREAKAEIMKLMSVQTISFDKINQLRHARFFGNADGVRKHMKDLAAQLIEHAGQRARGNRAPEMEKAGGWILRFGRYIARLREGDRETGGEGRREDDRRRRHLSLRKRPDGYEHPHRADLSFDGGTAAGHGSVLCLREAGGRQKTAGRAVTEEHWLKARVRKVRTDREEDPRRSMILHLW